MRKVTPGTFCSSLEWKVLTFPGAPDFLFMAEEYLAWLRAALHPHPSSPVNPHLLHRALRSWQVESGMVVNAYNLIPWEAEAGG